MAYKLSIKGGKPFYTGITLGNAFTALDNWCYDNKSNYKLDDIYHKFDNEIGIDVHTQDGKIKQFSIIES